MSNFSSVEAFVTDKFDVATDHMIHEEVRIIFWGSPLEYQILTVEETKELIRRLKIAVMRVENLDGMIKKDE